MIRPQTKLIPRTGGGLYAVPADFQAPHGRQRKPVKGGRWMVRRVEGYGAGREWRAWTLGKARNFSKRFATHAEAIDHAQRVASAFADPTPQAIARLVLQLHPTLPPARVNAYIERYAKIPKRKRSTS